MKIVRMRSVYGRTEQRRALVAADILSHSRGRAAGLDPVTELDAAVDQLDELRFGALLELVFLVIVVVVVAVPAAAASVMTGVIVFACPCLVDVGERQADLAVELLGDLSQGYGARGIGVLESAPGEPPLRVLMIEQVHEPIRRRSRPAGSSARRRCVEIVAYGANEFIHRRCRKRLRGLAALENGYLNETFVTSCPRCPTGPSKQQ